MIRQTIQHGSNDIRKSVTRQLSLPQSVSSSDLITPSSKPLQISQPLSSLSLRQQFIQSCEISTPPTPAPLSTLSTQSTQLPASTTSPYPPQHHVLGLPSHSNLSPCSSTLHIHSTPNISTLQNFQPLSTYSLSASTNMSAQLSSFSSLSSLSSLSSRNISQLSRQLRTTQTRNVSTLRNSSFKDPRHSPKPPNKLFTISTRRNHDNDKAPDAFADRRFVPYSNVSKDYYRQDIEHDYIYPHLDKDSVAEFWKNHFRPQLGSDYTFSRIFGEQVKVQQNLRKFENQAQRERLFGAKDGTKEIYWDRDMRQLERRQRYLLDRIYTEQVEAVINEFEEDYAPMVAAHIRKQKRAVFWQKVRYRFRFFLYPFSLALNSFFLAWRIYERRRVRETMITPRLITEKEFLKVRPTVRIRHLWRNRHRLISFSHDKFQTMRFFFDIQKDLLQQRTATAQTELLRFKKHSGVNNPKDLYSWWTKRSQYDPDQFYLRRQITVNMKEAWKGETAPKPKVREHLIDKRNPTMKLNEFDEKKLLHRWLHKFVLTFRLTAPSYEQQPFFVRKLREIIDIYYDVIIPNFYYRIDQRKSSSLAARIDRLLTKELIQQERMYNKVIRDMDNARNPNTWKNIKLGIQKQGTVFKYIRSRLRIWYFHRKNATLYDVAKNGQKYHQGPAGPPFWHVYLQTRHLLRSPFAHARVKHLTVGQEDAKSFLRKWSDMNADLHRYPRLRTIMIQAIHDNLTIRSTLYFRLSRYARRKKPVIDHYREEYFKEIERIFHSIFVKKERYSFQELYAMALNEWWFPSQQSIKKFDRFDKRWYDRHDDVDTSTLWSISTGIVTVVLFSLAYAYADGRKDYYQEQAAKKEKFLYTAKGADTSYYADQLLYADKRDDVIQELRYDGIMKLHDELSCRTGRLMDAYYSILGDSIRERYRKEEPAMTIVYGSNELSNIANTMKGKVRDLEQAETILLHKVQTLWCDSAVVFAQQHDISLHPESYPLDERQEQADIGHFLMTHIDKIAQSASFPEFEGEIQMGYVFDNGVLKLRPSDNNYENTQERVMSYDQEERLLRYGDKNPVNKYLSLSKGVTFVNHMDDCAISKLSRLETNFELLVQLLDAILQIQKDVGKAYADEERILEIPSSDEILQMYEKGTFIEWIQKWHKKHHLLLPQHFIPKDFAKLKAREIYQTTGDRTAANYFLTYFDTYILPGVHPLPQTDIDDFGNKAQAFDGIDEDFYNDPIALLLLETEQNKLLTVDQQLQQLFRPHVQLLVQNINRLVHIRPRLYRLVKDDFQKKFPWTVNLDPEVVVSDLSDGDLLRAWKAKQINSAMFEYHLPMYTGTVAEIDLDYQVPLMMAQELRFRQLMKGNTEPGTNSTLLRHLHPKPSELAGSIIDHEYEQQAEDSRTKQTTWAVKQAIEYKDEFNILRNPDNWDIIYEPQIYGWNIDEKNERTKKYLQWFLGDYPTQFDVENVSPTADEFSHLSITPFDHNAYYDAWTDIYVLNARRKDRIFHEDRPVGLAAPFRNLWIRQEQTDDPNDPTSLINMAMRIPEGYRFKFDSYNLRTYGTDHEFYSNRTLFYERIDRYFRYYKYFLNRQWSHDILDTGERWRKVKRFFSMEVKPISFYEDYFLSHGFRHFLTHDPVLARYGNDFFFRYFIDAPRFDRRPLALLDQHRYDKDGQDVYFDALYNTRALNNPYPLDVEHGNWSLKPWYDFVNAQFAVYRYLILSDGEYPTEFPQMYQHDINEIEKFVVPDIHFGYEAVHSWGKDLFDTTYKKLPDRDTHSAYKKKGHFDRPNYLDFHESYIP